MFQARRQGAPTGYLAHFAVSDIGGQRFSHQARVAQGGVGGRVSAGRQRLDAWQPTARRTRSPAEMQPGLAPIRRSVCSCD